jgi:hypothetical protein
MFSFASDVNIDNRVAVPSSPRSLAAPVLGRAPEHGKKSWGDRGV